MVKITTWPITGSVIRPVITVKHCRHCMVLKLVACRDRKDAAGRRPSDPAYDSRTLHLPTEFVNKLSGGQVWTLSMNKGSLMHSKWGIIMLLEAYEYPCFMHQCKCDNLCSGNGGNSRPSTWIRCCFSRWENELLSWLICGKWELCPSWPSLLV
jgi:hypothetical protein